MTVPVCIVQTLPPDWVGETPSRICGAGFPRVRAGLLGAPVGGGPPARRPRREPSARRVVSKPGQAPPPPTGTAARFSGLSGSLHTVGACVASKPGQAPPPPTGTAARPPGPSGALHTSGALSL